MSPKKLCLKTTEILVPRMWNDNGSWRRYTVTHFLWRRRRLWRPWRSFELDWRRQGGGNTYWDDRWVVFPQGGTEKMSLTVQQLLNDAKRLSSRLRDHDTSADNIIAASSSVLKEIEAMRQYQEDIDSLNSIAHNRPRAQLVLGKRKKSPSCCNCYA